MVFLTFGTGFGAGLILDGRLYSGTNDMAGEVGRIRARRRAGRRIRQSGLLRGLLLGRRIRQLRAA